MDNEENKKIKHFGIYVRKFPEENGGFIALPSDTKLDKIILTPFKRNAHRYEVKEDGFGSFKDWKEMFEEDGYFRDDYDLRNPEYKCVYFEDEDDED